MLESLRHALHAALGRSLPRPVFARAHRWRFARTQRPLGEPFAWDPAARIGVCGDWAFGGRVENAFRSGDGLGIEVASALGASAEGGG